MRCCTWYVEQWTECWAFAHQEQACQLLFCPTEVPCCLSKGSQRVKRCFAWSSQSVCCCVVYLMKVSERMCQENDVPLRLQLRRPCTITTAIAVPPLIAWSRHQTKSLGLVFVYLCALTRFHNWNQRAGALSIPQESVDVSEKVNSPMCTPGAVSRPEIVQNNQTWL